MIERFNFYDIYGYLIPGVLLGAVLWIPHALVQGLEVASDLTAALAAVVVAYVAGHLLQVLAAKVVPSTQPFKTANGVIHRYPSDRLLDDDDLTFPEAMKKRLFESIRTKFAIDVNVSGNRVTAFLLCRNSVIAGKTASYVEQFQGMYVLMRGIAAATAIGCAYDLGWLWSAFIARRDIIVSLIVFVATAVVAARYQWKLPASRTSSRMFFATLLLLGTTGAGALSAGGASRHMGLLSATACLSLLMTLWAFGSYRALTWTWAQTVYQHFYLSSQTGAEETSERKESS